MITVKVGKYIKEPATSKNEWHVKFQQMSGDADAYKDAGKWFKEKDIDEMLEYVTVVMAIEKIQEYGEGRDRKEIEKKLQKVLSPELFKKVQETDYISEICGWDVTREDCLAAVQSPSVFWFDTDSMKYECIIERSE